ncbi:DNA-directed RNA polymerase II subunit RPB2 [Tanacetum coccineum]
MDYQDDDYNNENEDEYNNNDNMIDDEEGEEGDDDEDITQEDAWAVISSYFEEKGLVRQQLDSFDEFIQNTMQEIVDESADIEIRPESQHNPGHQPDFAEVSCGASIRIYYAGFGWLIDNVQHRIDNESETIYKISFGQIYLSKPMMTESDGETATLFPKAARLRNLTYSAPLYVDVTKRAIKKGHDCEEVTETQDFGKVFIGKVPIMLRSSYCTLFQNSEKDLTELGECPYDQGGYFIINGSEKVLIAQEKMSTNHVYVFKKRQPNKYAYVGEVRSMAESQNRPPSTMFVRMLARTSAKGGSSGQYIRATLPYIRTEIPIIIVFRALGFVADKDILEHICYDFADTQMMELLRPSLEEAFVIQNQQVALDYIGKRGATVGVTKEKRIKYARDILQKEMLPHVGVGEYCETKKAYYFGYIIHRLLLCALGRRAEDDRDHYGNKRLDLAGPLLGGLFRMLFRKLTRDVRGYVQKVKIEGGLNASASFMAKSNPLNRAPHKQKSELHHALCNILSNILALLADGGKGKLPPLGVDPSLNMCDPIVFLINYGPHTEQLYKHLRISCWVISLRALLSIAISPTSQHVRLEILHDCILSHEEGLRLLLQLQCKVMNDQPQVIGHFLPIMICGYRITGHWYGFCYLRGSIVDLDLPKII